MVMTRVVPLTKQTKHIYSQPEETDQPPPYVDERTSDRDRSEPCPNAPSSKQGDSSCCPPTSDSASLSMPNLSKYTPNRNTLGIGRTEIGNSVVVNGLPNQVSTSTPRNPDANSRTLAPSFNIPLQMPLRKQAVEEHRTLVYTPFYHNRFTELEDS